MKHTVVIMPINALCKHCISMQVVIKVQQLCVNIIKYYKKKLTILKIKN